MATIDDALANLNASLQGDYYILCCPKCGQREAYCYIDDIKKWYKNPDKYKIPIRCNRMNKCGEVSYLNDFLEGVDISKPLTIKEKSPVQMSEEGIKYIQMFVRYVTDSIMCNMKGFDFDMRGISNQILKDNRIIYYDRCFETIVNIKENSAYYSNKYRSDNYKDRDILIPIFNKDNVCERILLRSTFHDKQDEKYKKEIQVVLKKKGTELWNMRNIFNDSKDIIYVTEGVYDALSILEVCKDDKSIGAVALPGVGKYKHLINLLNEYPRLKLKTFILAFDNDEAGEKTIKKAISDFYENEIEVKRLLLKKYKDCNEYLQADKKGFKKLIENKNKKIREGEI